MADQTPTLHIYALGPPKVRLGENLVTFSTRKPWPVGLKSTVSSWLSANRANPLKMLTFSASIEPTGKMCWMPTCSPD